MAERENYITWTSSSVTSFWDFLLAIQKAKTLGPISISFHAASAPAYPLFLGYTSTEPDLSAVDADHAEVVASESSARNANLLNVDHIKVYHDVTYSMYLRNTLDAWGYHFQSPRDLNLQIPDGEDGARKVERRDNEASPVIRTTPPPTANVKSKKIRMLKGAVLVLVDDSLNGVLLS